MTGSWNRWGQSAIRPAKARWDSTESHEPSQGWLMPTFCEYGYYQPQETASTSLFLGNRIIRMLIMCVCMCVWCGVQVPDKCMCVGPLSDFGMILSSSFQTFFWISWKALFIDSKLLKPNPVGHPTQVLCWMWYSYQSILKSLCWHQMLLGLNKLILYS